MPARWVDLLLRINHTLDQADAALDDGDRNVFYTHVIANATRRQPQRIPRPLEHPLPQGPPLSYRDPTGEDEAHV